MKTKSLLTLLILVFSVKTGFCGQNPFNPLQFDSLGAVISITNGASITNPVLEGAVTMTGSTNTASNNLVVSPASILTYSNLVVGPGLIQYVSNGIVYVVTNGAGATLPLVGAFQTITVTNPANFKNNVTNIGTNFSAGGYASSNSAAAVSISATGITNNLGVNAFAYVICTNITFTNYNGAGTAIFTNTSSTFTGTPFPLQPKGKITSGAGLSGRLVPL